MQKEKPFSQACENNKAPILEVLHRLLRDTQCLMEIGSGTGQHAVYFAEKLPHLLWRPSDVSGNLPAIELWCGEYTGTNLAQPLPFNIANDEWPVGIAADAVFSANTAHIMDWSTVLLMFQKVGAALNPDGLFLLYGPFKYSGEYTSASNASFDQWLKSIQSHQGIRDFEKVDEVARSVGLQLLEDNAMPANNQILVWRKI